jgi:hypothetical protein
MTLGSNLGTKSIVSYFSASSNIYNNSQSMPAVQSHPCPHKGAGLLAHAHFRLLVGSFQGWQ